jgi:hypothetical protein
MDSLMKIPGFLAIGWTLAFASITACDTEDAEMFADQANDDELTLEPEATYERNHANPAEISADAEPQAIPVARRRIRVGQCRGYIAPIYRYWNPGIGDHFYTTNWSELRWGAQGWNFERQEGWLFDDQFVDCGAVGLHRYWNPTIGDHFYTTDYRELRGGGQGWQYEGVAGYCFPNPRNQTTPLFRYWNSNIGDHFYTTNWSELRAGQSGYTLERIECYVRPN